MYECMNGFYPGKLASFSGSLNFLSQGREDERLGTRLRQSECYLIPAKRKRHKTIFPNKMILKLDTVEKDDLVNLVNLER